VILVKKKDGSWRFCVNYHRLNSITIQDAYPLPRINESLDALEGSKYFSTLDLLSGYWQVPLSPDAQDKAAFIICDRFKNWKVLPFGLTSALATFQRLIDQVLSGPHWKTFLIYLNDVIVISSDFSTDVSRLRKVFDRLRACGLKLKPSKCVLLQPEVTHLDHVVGCGRVATDQEKVQAVKEWAVLSDLLLRAAGIDTYGPGNPVPIPAHERPLSDTRVNQSRTTPYHLQENRVVKKNNRMFGDALRSLLLG